MLILRDLEKKLLQLSKKFPVVSVLGPRQSGKTTLVRMSFPKKPYVSLEDIDVRIFAQKDPRGFLTMYESGAIFDEIQRVPELFSYLQTTVDSKKENGRFILTGSHNYLLQENMNQTLAGRVALLTLLPLSISELSRALLLKKNIFEILFLGFYPRIYDEKIEPRDWYPNYIQTYLERDVRFIKNIPDLLSFQKFIKLCAGRTGQILNLSQLGNDAGISHNTARSWLSILESSYLVFFVPPYYKNFNKRITKMPKFYFYDSALLCSLLGIEDAEQLKTHYAQGAIFESFIMSEMKKYSFNQGIEPQIFYFRDQMGREVDGILEMRGKQYAFEIKLGKTIHQNFFDGLNYWRDLTKISSHQLSVIYGGEENQKRTQAKIVSWKNIEKIFEQI